MLETQILCPINSSRFMKSQIHMQSMRCDQHTITWLSCRWSLMDPHWSKRQRPPMKRRRKEILFAPILNDAEQQKTHVKYHSRLIAGPFAEKLNIRKRSATFCTLHGRQSLLNLRMILQRELRLPKLPGRGGSCLGIYSCTLLVN